MCDSDRGTFAFTEGVEGKASHARPDVFTGHTLNIKESRDVQLEKRGKRQIRRQDEEICPAYPTGKDNTAPYRSTPLATTKVYGGHTTFDNAFLNEPSNSENDKTLILCNRVARSYEHSAEPLGKQDASCHASIVNVFEIKDNNPIRCEPQECNNNESAVTHGNPANCVSQSIKKHPDSAALERGESIFPDQEATVEPQKICQMAEGSSEVPKPCDVSCEVTNSVCAGNCHTIERELRKARVIDFYCAEITSHASSQPAVNPVTAPEFPSFPSSKDSCETSSPDEITGRECSGDIDTSLLGYKTGVLCSSPEKTDDVQTEVQSKKPDDIKKVNEVEDPTVFVAKENALPEIPEKSDTCAGIAPVREKSKKSKKPSKPYTVDGIFEGCITSLGTVVPHDDLQASAGWQASPAVNPVL